MSTIDTLESREDVRPAQLGHQLLFWLALGVVLLVGAALRFYRLDSQRLWLDELFTAELVRGGLDTIWHNAFADHTLPLPNMTFWLAAQIGGLSAFSLRMVSAITASLALPLYYYYCTIITDRRVALLATSLFAIGPLAVYYAQEARPYALPLLAQMFTFLAYLRLRRHENTANWARYSALAILATHLHYINLIPIGAQLLALLILARRRRTVLVGGFVSALSVAATLAPFVSGVRAEIGNWQQASLKLHLLSSMQTMVAGDARITPAAARTAALAVLAAGVAVSLLDRRKWPLLLPHALQIGFLLLIAFVLLPLVGRPVPTYDERQFLVILPSALICFSIGVFQLAATQTGRLLATALAVVLTVTSCMGLARYFDDFVKSPEGVLADTIAAHAHPDDVVLCDGGSYSVDAALRFYYPTLPVYTYRGMQAGRWSFASNTTLIQSRMPSEHRVEIDSMTRNRRLWFVQRDGSPPPFATLLRAQYQTREEYLAAVFHAQLLER